MAKSDNKGARGSLLGGEAEGVSAVVLFPPRNKGRIRKSNSLEAMGRCSISLLERDSENIPANVTDMRHARPEPDVNAGRIALRLALALFATLDAKRKKDIRDAVRLYARHDDSSAGDESRTLYRLIAGGNRHAD
jgi:hypothetical protein